MLPLKLFSQRLICSHAQYKGLTSDAILSYLSSSHPEECIEHMCPCCAAADAIQNNVNFQARVAALGGEDFSLHHKPAAYSNSYYAIAIVDSHEMAVSGDEDSGCHLLQHPW